MKIELHRILIRELIEGYVDDAESGVRGYGGRLDIRPVYQREFVYKEKERNAVYAGQLVADAKRYFSKPGCVAQKIAAHYVKFQ